MERVSIYPYNGGGGAGGGSDNEDDRGEQKVVSFIL